MASLDLECEVIQGLRIERIPVHREREHESLVLLCYMEELCLRDLRRQAFQRSQIDDAVDALGLPLCQRIAEREHGFPPQVTPDERSGRHGSGIAIRRRGDLRSAVTPSRPDLVSASAMSYALDRRCNNPGTRATWLGDPRSPRIVFGPNTHDESSRFVANSVMLCSFGQLSNWNGLRGIEHHIIDRGSDTP